MSFRGVVPDWADVPADIEIGKCYGKMEDVSKHGEDFGVDLDGIIAYNKVHAAFDMELFKPIKINVSPSTSTNVSKPSYSTGDDGSNVKSTTNKFVTREQLRVDRGATAESPKVYTTPKTISTPQGRPGLEKMNTSESKARIDLSQAKWELPTVVIHKKDEIDDTTAFNILKKFVSINFGTSELVLEHDGMLYRFSEEYRISEDVKELEAAFDTQVFSVKPKIKISL